MVQFARRAAGLSATLPGAHFPSELPRETILFDSGFAAPELLPDLTAAAHSALTAFRQETLQYSPRHGEPALREWLAALMTEDGCAVAPDDILIVNGAKNGLDLICRLLIDEGDTIIVSAPTYFTAIPIFTSFGAQFIEVPQDAEGIDVAALEHELDRRRSAGLPAAKFLYDVPEFHNPTGITTSMARRDALIELAHRHGFLIVEDTPYRRVRFDGEPVPPLKARDRYGLVLHLGTFSKLVAPGLRVGWVAAARELIARLGQLKADGGTSPLLQRIVYEFARSPAFAAHVAQVRDSYRARRDRALAALAQHLPDARITVPEGGYYLWITLPSEIDGDALARAAERDDVRVIPGSKFFASADTADSAGHRARHHLRLSYSYASPDQIDEGIARLGRAYQALLGR